MKNSVKNYTSKDLITALWSETLDSAYQKMGRAHIRHLPVINDDGEVVGIISDRDFQRAIWVQSDDRIPKARFDVAANVKDYMTTPVESVPSDAKLSDVARRMVIEKISAFLVTKNENIIGIITHEDLLRALVHLLETRTDRDDSVKLSVSDLTYNSPVGHIVNSLNFAGI
ncbi:MAG: CBS domain-containing protein [Pseudomonadota bacterium]|nr:CBS domain-containing protein [Pseudomonadota bacterium]